MKLKRKKYIYETKTKTKNKSKRKSHCSGPALRLYAPRAKNKNCRASPPFILCLVAHLKAVSVDKQIEAVNKNIYIWTTQFAVSGSSI